MLKKSTLLFIFIFYCVNVFGQIKQTAFEMDSILKPIIFYGYDLSHVRLVDKKRLGQDMKEFIPKINKYLTNKISSRGFATLTGADSLIYNFNALTNLNKQIVDSNIVTDKKYLISEDSLQNYVDSYDIQGEKGTGCVIIFESFETNSKTTSAFIVVFDIENRDILFWDYVKSYDNFKNSKLSVWTPASYYTVVKLARRLSWDEIKRKKEAEIFTKSYVLDTASFKPTFFKTSKNELPVTFGINPVIGVSSTYISSGLHINADIFHIMLGYRKIYNPVIDYMVDESLNEEAYLIGYRFRKNKYAVSLASGFGRTWVHCTSGVGGDCENFNEETVSSVPIFIEYTYFMNPYAGLTVSLNASMSSGGSTIGLLFGIKLGISRKWSEMRPYNK